MMMMVMMMMMMIPGADGDSFYEYLLKARAAGSTAWWLSIRVLLGINFVIIIV